MKLAKSAPQGLYRLRKNKPRVKSRLLCSLFKEPLIQFRLIGQGIAGVWGVFDRKAAGFRKHKTVLGKVLPFRIRKLRPLDSSGLPTEEDVD